MAQYLIEDIELTAIANKLREKSGKTDEIKGSDFVSEIDNLEKINNSEIVKAIAQDKIQIGDTVYTIDKSPYDLETDFYCPALDLNVNSASFSPDGKTLILGGRFTGYAKIYSVDGTTITYVSDIYADNNNTALNGNVESATFSPDGKLLVLGGEFNYNAKVYSVNGTTVTYVNNIYADNSTTALSSGVYSISFSPDGKLLVLGAYLTGKSKVYSVNGNTIAYVSDIYADNNNTTLTGTINSVAFSPDGKTLVLGGQFTNKAKIYSVNGTTITYANDIYADNNNTILSGEVYSVTFSPDGNLLVLGGDFTGKAKAYSVNDTTITYVSDIYANNGTTAFSSGVGAVAFSPDGKTLVLGSRFGIGAKVYSVNGTTITYVSNIYADNNNTTLQNIIISATFSPDGKTLILGGNFTGYAKVYSANSTIITYANDIYADNDITSLNGVVYSVAFSPNGNLLVLGGDFTGKAKVYSINGATITYVSDIYANNNNTALSSYVYSAAFSPDGKALVLGGGFSGRAKVYSVNDTTITYVSNIYANAGTTTLSSLVRSISFSPDGKTLVLGGSFTGYAKVYSANGTTITYVNDIYADNNNTALSSSVNSATFSPDDKTLILGGEFTGKAKVYSVNGTTITYVSDIYANNSNTALNGAMNSASFSPNGNLLVIGGNFSSRAKVYSVNGATITYVSDIYANNNNTALSSYARSIAFSPDGNILVLGGYFSGKAKAYSVNGTTITYVSDIYADNNNTTLNGDVESTAFSPNGKLLVLGGQFNGFARVYQIDDTTVHFSDIGYPVPNGEFTILPYGSKLGFSKSAGEIGEEITVKTIGTVAVPLAEEVAL